MCVIIVLPLVSLLSGWVWSLVTSPYGYCCYLLPSFPVVGLFPPLYLFLCLSLFRRYSHLALVFPLFCKLDPCLFVSDFFGYLSSFILIMCPAYLIWLLTILPIRQASAPIYSLTHFIILLSNIFTLAILLIQLFLFFYGEEQRLL